MVALLSYLYAMYKVVIYNHSGKPIDKISLEAEFVHREQVHVDDRSVLKYNLFCPFKKTVRITVKQPGHINSLIFHLEGFFPGEQMNQVEICADGSIKQGALGLE